MTTLAVPATNRRPLSAHGMPKPPRVNSLDLPHRFSALGYPPQPFISGPYSPGTSSPMSPPMSARSFGTFIDSAPSTPAYSPRMDYDWDSSALVLLRTMSSSSEPSSPTEPVWDMIAPEKQSQRVISIPATKPTGRFIPTKEMPVVTSLSAPPVKRLRLSRQTKPPKEVKAVEPSEKEHWSPNKEDDREEKAPEEQSTDTCAHKLASKMRSMLRRRSTTDKKKEKKEKEKDYYDRIEDVHWTEM